MLIIYNEAAAALGLKGQGECTIAISATCLIVCVLLGTRYLHKKGVLFLFLLL